MSFNEIKSTINSYVDYCNWFLGTTLKLYRNKQLNQFEIYFYTKNTRVGKLLLTIETGYLSKNITIRCNRDVDLSKSVFKKNIKEIGNCLEITIFSLNELNDILYELEKIGFFKNEYSY